MAAMCWLWTLEDTEQLRQPGQPAVAEIAWLTRIPGQGYGELDTALLHLRISGEGVPPFEATYRCDHQPGFRVGARLDAVVDPSDNVFTLMPI